MWNSENFRSELVKLKDLDNLIKCGICYEYLKTTLITPCSHNYCSYCIRQSLSYKNQCPSCFEDINESQLRNNRIVDEFISIFICIKEKLHRYLAYLPNSKVNYESSEANLEKTVVKKEVIEECATKFPTSNNGPNELIRHGGTPTKSMPSTSKKEVLIPSMFSPKKQKSLNINETKVACPVCNVEISEKNINIHLDACLKRSHEKRIPPDEKRKPLPKLVYHLLPEKELRKKLNDLGLNTVGDRSALINRHKRYTILYNSECDSLKPRPVTEIIKQLKKEEEEEKKLAPQVTKKLNVDRKADPQVNEEAQRQYLLEHKSSFQKLIEEARRSKVVKRNISSPNIDEPKIITIDENSETSEISDNEIKAKRSHKRKKIISESEGEGENDINGSKDNVPQTDNKLSTNRLQVQRDSEHSFSVSDKENEKIECKTVKIECKQLDMYKDSTDEMETDDDLSENLSQEIMNNWRKSPKDHRTLQPQTRSNSVPSVTSPILLTKSRVNRTPKSEAGQIQFFKRDLTPDLKSPKAFALLPSPGEVAGQGLEEDVVESDSSSNHSTSLMVYTGPDYENSLDLCSPMKTPNKSDSQIESMTPSAKANFDLGIDDILQNTEEFVSLPIRRQSKRIKETKRSSPKTSTRGRVRQKRVRIDDL